MTPVGYSCSVYVGVWQGVIMQHVSAPGASVAPLACQFTTKANSLLPELGPTHYIEWTPLTRHLARPIVPTYLMNIICWVSIYIYIYIDIHHIYYIYINIAVPSLALRGKGWTWTANNVSFRYGCRMLNCCSTSQCRFRFRVNNAPFKTNDENV